MAQSDPLEQWVRMAFKAHPVLLVRLGLPALKVHVVIPELARPVLLEPWVQQEIPERMEFKVLLVLRELGEIPVLKVKSVILVLLVNQDQPVKWGILVKLVPQALLAKQAHKVKPVLPDPRDPPDNQVKPVLPVPLVERDPPALPEQLAQLVRWDQLVWPVEGSLYS